MPPTPTDTPSAAAPRDLPLDGLRGIAIFLVVLYHATLLRVQPSLGPDLLFSIPGMGWSGVDLFFVLSGFLITRILVQQHGAENYFRAFYARRVLRIFPLYYAFLAICILVIPNLDALARLDHFWMPNAEREFGWYAVFLGNFHAGLAGHFHHNFLSITWSLAIEEHFYLLWPLLVAFVSTRNLERVCLGVLVLGLVLRCAALAQESSPLMIYILTPFRLDGLAVGAWLALRSERAGGFAGLDRIARLALPAAGLAVLAIILTIAGVPEILGARKGLVLLSHPLMQSVGYLSLAIFYGALLTRLMAAAPGAWLRRAFQLRPLMALGRVSFAMYLLHVPAVRLAQEVLWNPAKEQFQPVLLGQFLFYLEVFAIAYAASELSWRLLESPILSLRRHFPFRHGQQRAADAS